MDLGQLFDRVEWCRAHECLPFIMRDQACWEAPKPIKNFLIDYASYCNQPGFFKKLTFRQFEDKRQARGDISAERRDASLSIYERSAKE
jgi:hypothetical protein